MHLPLSYPLTPTAATIPNSQFFRLKHTAGFHLRVPVLAFLVHRRHWYERIANLFCSFSFPRHFSCSRYQQGPLFFPVSLLVSVCRHVVFFRLRTLKHNKTMAVMANADILCSQDLGCHVCAFGAFRFEGRRLLSICQTKREVRYWALCSRKEFQRTPPLLLTDVIHAIGNRIDSSLTNYQHCATPVFAPVLVTPVFKPYTAPCPLILAAAIRLAPSANTPTCSVYFIPASGTAKLSPGLCIN